MSILDRAKTNGFTALLITFEVHGVGWRPHDLELGYHPYTHGIGSQAGKSDPVFMARYNRSPVHERPEFPYDPRDHEKYAQSGDHEMKQIGLDWLEEVNSGGCHSWEDLISLKKLWQGPLIVKGIMNVLVSLIFIIHCVVLFKCSKQDAEKVLDCGADGIVISNQGGFNHPGLSLRRLTVPQVVAISMEAYLRCTASK